MKAYLAIKFYEDFSNRQEVEALLGCLEEAGFESVCVVRDCEAWGRYTFQPSVLMQKSFDLIEASDVVVIELSEKGVGLGIEAGYAHAKGIPVVTIAKTGSDISKTLRGISDAVFHYHDYTDLTAPLMQLRQKLQT